MALLSVISSRYQLSLNEEDHLSWISLLPPPLQSFAYSRPPVFLTQVITLPPIALPLGSPHPPPQLFPPHRRQMETCKTQTWLCHPLPCDPFMGPIALCAYKLFMIEPLSSTFPLHPSLSDVFSSHFYTAVLFLLASHQPPMCLHPQSSDPCNSLMSIQLSALN